MSSSRSLASARPANESTPRPAKAQSARTHTFVAGSFVFRHQIFKGSRRARVLGRREELADAAREDLGRRVVRIAAEEGDRVDDDLTDLLDR